MNQEVMNQDTRRAADNINGDHEHRTGGESTPQALPAQRIDSDGRLHLDLRIVVALAAPLIANSAIQILLSLTDTWFVGRLSTRAMAAIGAVQWLVIVVAMLFGAISLAAQTVVSQAFGGRRYTRCAQAVWVAFWGVIISVPLYVVVGVAGQWVLRPFDLDPDVERLAASFWLTRVAGTSVGVATLAVIGFFNGIGQTRVTFYASIVVALANMAFNQLFIFGFGWGITGSGLATAAAQVVGLVYVLAIFLGEENRRRYRSHLVWGLCSKQLVRQLRLGFPMALLYAADVIGIALFQLMQVKIDPTDGAATQIVMTVMSIACMPGAGMSLAGAILVGQSIGAGDRAWAMIVGTRITLFSAICMGCIGVLVALSGPWLLPLFTSARDDQSVAVTVLGGKFLWAAAAYQFFDGISLGSGYCLRGAGDVVVPATTVLLLSWCVFVPLAHMLTFAPRQGWLEGLPQFGWGAFGGWIALIIYALLLGTMLFARWRSGAWQSADIQKVRPSR